MGRLTTHVLDISAGIPAAGIVIELHREGAGAPKLLRSVSTGVDGRCAAPLLAGDELTAGRYSLTFHVADYFRARGVSLPDPAFIDRALIQFGVADPDQHYHVPLLVAPWSYSVYRGG
jgi:5-hydroxyisourate hydrolase